MAIDEDTSEDRDSVAMARAMLDRLAEAIDLAHAIGAERLAELLEQAARAAREQAEPRRSASVH